MHFDRIKFGMIDEGTIEIISISDDDDQFRVQLSNLGANIVKIEMIDKNGTIAPITLGHNDVTHYMKDPGYFGATIGRTVSRTVNAQFNLNGRTFHLSKNKGEMHAHGGIRGFNLHRWEIVTISQTPNKIQVHFSLISPDGDEGYPGTLKVNCVYSVSPFEITWDYTASSDQPTIVNLTNHSYWNLNGVGLQQENIKSLRLQLSAYIEQILNQGIPTAQLRPVQNTVLDFRQSKMIGDVLDHGDIDNVFVIEHALDQNNRLKFRKVAALISSKTGRQMEISSTEPCVIVYTGNYLDGLESYGIKCRKHDALCLEMIRPVNAVNFPQFASWVILNPSEQYYQKTMHKFFIQK